MKTIMSFLIISAMLIIGSNALGAEVCYDDVCFPGGDASFADSYVSYDPSADVEPPYNNPLSAEGSPDYEEGKDGGFVSLGCYGVLVVQFTDNSLTTSGDSNADLWIFEIGSSVGGGTSEPTNIDISTDGTNWIEVGSTSGDTSGIDIDAYIGYGVVQGEKYSYVRITDRNCVDLGLSYAGADIDAVGAIESAAPVSTTSTTTTVSPETTTTTSVSGDDTTTTTTVADGDDCTDNDGDGFAIEGGACGYIDCDDNDSTVYPGAPENCEDGKDNDCDGKTDYDDTDCGGCTASFVLGDDDQRLDTIRRFRDEVLAGNAAGRKIIDLYNKNSAEMTAIFEKHPTVKKLAKKVLESLIPAMELLLEK